MTQTAYQNDLSPTTGKWFAVLTKVKAEKMVCQSLVAAGIQCYVPLQKVIRVYARKKRTSMIPLIYRYIFVHIKKQSYVQVLEKPNIEGFVRFNKDLISIPDAEIDWLQRVTGESNNIALENRPYSPGEPVEVVMGNLTGLKGKLIKSLGKNELLIELDHIGFGLRIQVDPAHLRSLQ
ncbi:MAG: UpxY family transcription antiterminator [Saprospiraceae bacterium]|nr:UpxY family transcription antiterminator [Saprospiraceae bacterium]